MNYSKIFKEILFAFDTKWLSYDIMVIAYDKNWGILQVVYNKDGYINYDNVDITNCIIKITESHLVSYTNYKRTIKYKFRDFAQDLIGTLHYSDGRIFLIEEIDNYCIEIVPFIDFEYINIDYTEDNLNLIENI